jgi:hypothetical protein
MNDSAQYIRCTHEIPTPRSIYNLSLVFSLLLPLQWGAAATAAKARADVNIDIGAEPECPYGYYDYAPYACAPYG